MMTEQAIGNMHKKFAKFDCMIFELCEQTDRETNILISILHTPLGGKVIEVQPDATTLTACHKQACFCATSRKLPPKVTAEYV